MKSILVFGSTGHAGRAIVRVLLSKGYTVTAVARQEAKARVLLPGVHHIIEADATRLETLRDICSGQDVIISALGKSVSPNDWSRPGFEEVDLQANLNILSEAQKAGVQQFIYISAFWAEKLRRLTYFRVHDDVSQALMKSGLTYAVVQPPAIMSSFIDLADMAKRGFLVTIGQGEHRTNPISENDLALVVESLIGQPSQTISAGGKHIYTRHEINEIIQQSVSPGRRVRRIPQWFLRAALPFWKIINRNMYDKLVFFDEVINHDLLAPQTGETSLEQYFEARKNY